MSDKIPEPERQPVPAEEEKPANRPSTDGHVLMPQDSSQAQEGVIHPDGPEFTYAPSGKGSSLVVGRFTSGPLPSPELLREYRDIDPSIVDLITGMAREEQAHRHRMDRDLVGLERQEQTNRSQAVRRGQYVGGLLVVFSVFMAVVLVKMGHPAVASLLVGVNLVGLAAVFARSTRPESKPTKSPDAPSEEMGED